MQDHDGFIRGLETVAATLESEIEKLDSRLATLQETRATKRRKHDAVIETIATYREVHKLPVPAPVTPDDLREQWAGLSTRDMIVRYAEIYGGQLNVRKAADVLVEAGLFKDHRNASGNIYATLDRYPEMVRKVRRGHYEVVQADVAMPTPIPQARLPIEDAPPPVVPFPGAPREDRAAHG